MDSLLKERAQLLVEKKEEPKKDAAAVEPKPSDSPLVPLPGAEAKENSAGSTAASSTPDSKPKN